MKNFDRFYKPAIWSATVLLTTILAACGGGSGGGTGAAGAYPGSPGSPGPVPNIGTSSTYGVFASSAAVTLAANSVVNGDVGLYPIGAPCTGCVVGTTVTGAIHNGDPAARQAQTDFNNAYIDASTRTTNACVLASAELSAAQGSCNGVTPGPIYGPGLYRMATAIGIGSGLNITLDANGDANAVFIFQTDAALTTGTNSVIHLTGNAKAKNVYWVVGSAATLGVSSTFKGTVLANGAAVHVLGGTILAPTLVEGRLFSHSAGATVDTYATVTVPQ
jgi:hypothetical protein